MNCKLREIASVFFRVLWRATRKKKEKNSIDFSREGRKCMRVDFHMSTKQTCGWKSTTEIFSCLTEYKFYLFTSKSTSKNFVFCISTMKTTSYNEPI